MYHSISLLVTSNVLCKLNKIILILQPIKLNNTRKAQKEILFFNRVPKVGSQTTMELMRALALKNNFHYHKDRTQKVETIKLTNNVLKSCIIGNKKYIVSRTPYKTYVKSPFPYHKPSTI